MPGTIATLPRFQFSDALGTPLAGGSLSVYVAGGTTPTPTYQDQALTIANTNPVQLDASGACVLWLDSAKAYKFVLANAQGVVQWTQDNISGAGGLLSNSLRTDLAAATGAALVGSIQGVAGAVLRTVQDKLRESISVKDFGAVCDGVTDDAAAIQKAQEYLKANGGGKLYFPGWCLINSPFYFYGSVTGAWSSAYPLPTQPKITWESDGQHGIRAGAMASGDVLRLSKPSTSTALDYNVGFKDFAVDCAGKNVTALNGTSYLGLGGGNHYVSIDNLVIQGIQGPQAIGVDFGTITDSNVAHLTVQGFGTGPYAGVRLNKTDVQLVNCRFIYCIHSIVIGTLAEACLQMTGGAGLSPKISNIHWESPGADYKNSASVLTGVFFGETNTTAASTQGPLMSATAGELLDIGAVTFSGCMFDNWTTSANLANVDFGGKFSFIGCSNWNDSTGSKTIKFGQYCNAVLMNNAGFSVDLSSPSLALGKTQSLPQAGTGNIHFTPSLVATGCTFSYALDGQHGYISRAGNTVTVVIRLQLNTAGNTLAANAVSIAGLPVAAAASMNEHAIGAAGWINTATALSAMSAVILAGSSVIALNKVTTSSTSSFNALVGTDLHATNGSVIYLTMSYIAA